MLDTIKAAWRRWRHPHGPLPPAWNAWKGSAMKDRDDDMVVELHRSENPLTVEPEPPDRGAALYEEQRRHDDAFRRTR